MRARAHDPMARSVEEIAALSIEPGHAIVRIRGFFASRYVPLHIRSVLASLVSSVQALCISSQRPTLASDYSSGSRWDTTSKEVCLMLRLAGSAALAQRPNAQRLGGASSALDPDREIVRPPPAPTWL
jgi:hypothetical protein